MDKQMIHGKNVKDSIESKTFWGQLKLEMPRWCKRGRGELTLPPRCPRVCLCRTPSGYLIVEGCWLISYSPLYVPPLPCCSTPSLTPAHFIPRSPPGGAAGDRLHIKNIYGNYDIFESQGSQRVACVCLDFCPLRNSWKQLNSISGLSVLLQETEAKFCNIFIFFCSVTSRVNIKCSVSEVGNHIYS